MTLLPVEFDENGGEAQFQNVVMSMFEIHGWRAYHAPDNRPIAAKSGRKYVQRVTPGFPDVVAIRGEEIIVAELKTEKGRLSADQVEWLDDLRAFAASVEQASAAARELEFVTIADPGPAPVFEVHVWRPSEMQAIADRIGRPRRDA